MDLVERYLEAVARELPEGQGEDIVAELRDVLLSKVEEQEAELGRPLAVGELELLLKTVGHPVAVAGRYRSHNYLIGPDVFPFYLRALKIAFYLFLALHLLLLVLHIARAEASAWALIPGLIDALWSAAIYAGVVVTLVFAVIERTEGTSKLLRWRPRDLPPVGQRKGRGGLELAFDGVFEVVFLAWWVGAIRFVDLLPGPRPLSVSLAPVWDVFYWPVLAVSAASLASVVLSALRPGRTATVAVELGVAAVTAGLAVILLTLGPWVTVGGEALEPPAAAIRASILNTIVFWVLLGVAVVHAFEALGAGSRLVGRPLLRLPRLSKAL